MTRSHILTQMERLVGRLQSDRAPYTVEEISRLRELRDDLGVLFRKASGEPPLFSWRNSVAENNGADLNGRE